MQVPNHGGKPFRDMTPKERSAIVEAWVRGDAEVLIGDIDWGRIVQLDLNDVYRTKPRQLVIPWEHIKEEYKWAAMGRCHEVKLFIEKPKMDNDRWVSANGGGFCYLEGLKISKDGIDWRESLVQRPEGV